MMIKRIWAIAIAGTTVGLGMNLPWAAQEIAQPSSPQVEDFYTGDVNLPAGDVFPPQSLDLNQRERQILEGNVFTLDEVDNVYTPAVSDNDESSNNNESSANVE